jgi:NitT/TauT family transport system ATP-binding protein
VFQERPEDELNTRRLKVVRPPVAERGPEKVLELQGVRKVFPAGGAYRAVLEGIDITVRRGELICLLGRSGCGKSTLLNIIAGFMPPSAGKVLLRGQPALRSGPDRCVVFQEDALFPWLTVAENIAFGLRAKACPRRRVKAEVDRFLDLVGLNEFRDYLPREISGGMKQRVALARVLVLSPQVLLMDEPFAALDAQTRDEMQHLMLTLWDRLNQTIMFVTHNVQEAVALADRVLFMVKDPGRIRQDIHVRLPRPRQKDTPAFMALCQEFLEALWV